MRWRYLQKRDLNYITGILLIVVFLWMFVTGLIQLAKMAGVRLALRDGGNRIWIESY